MISSLSFTKGHGTLNDFVLLLDEHGELDLTAAHVRFLADRRGGIGGDGVIRAIRAGALAGLGVPEAATVDPELWFMDYWNADGSYAQMCGNGARVFGAFLEQAVGADLSSPTVIGTRAGLRTLRSLPQGGYSVDMGIWRIEDEQNNPTGVAVRGVTDVRPALLINVGNPHTVIALSTDAELAAADLSEAPQVHPAPPEGTNVELVVPLGERIDEDGVRRGIVKMRVHERGSGETMSCGTGAVASALAVRNWLGDGAPEVWEVAVPGGIVVVRVRGDGAVLEGPAQLIAQGVVELPGS